MFLLLLITFGCYAIYWLVVTKGEVNRLGAKIPTAWLLLIPFANIYFLYKFTQGFSIFILDHPSDAFAYFLVLFFLWPFSTLIFQWHMNRYAGGFRSEH